MIALPIAGVLTLHTFELDMSRAETQTWSPASLHLLKAKLCNFQPLLLIEVESVYLTIDDIAHARMPALGATYQVPLPILQVTFHAICRIDDSTKVFEYDLAVFNFLGTAVLLMWLHALANDLYCSCFDVVTDVGGTDHGDAFLNGGGGFEVLLLYSFGVHHHHHLVGGEVFGGEHCWSRHFECGFGRGFGV